MEGNNTFSITELNFIGNRVINIKIKEKLSLQPRPGSRSTRASDGGKCSKSRRALSKSL